MKRDANAISADYQVLEEKIILHVYEMSFFIFFNTLNFRLFFMKMIWGKPFISKLDFSTGNFPTKLLENLFQKAQMKEKNFNKLWEDDRVFARKCPHIWCTEKSNRRTKFSARKCLFPVNIQSIRKEKITEDMKKYVYWFKILK